MILASQSPRRRELLAAAGFELAVAPARIDETRHDGEAPLELVSRLAREKAQACRSRLSEVPADGLLVAADTIVWTDESIVLGKPADAADARRMLRALSGRTHHVSTGVSALLLSPTAEQLDARSFVETADVTFWPLEETVIDAYVATGEPFDKAGSYGIQGAGRLLVQVMCGDYATVVGLPIARLVRELATLTGRADLVVHALERGTHV